MSKKLMGTLLLVAAITAPARADKLIRIPTAGLNKLAAEYMNESGEDRNILTAQVSLGQAFELLGRRYRDFPGRDDSTEVGGQVQVLPEGFATPGLSIGIWDVADDTPVGRRLFLAVSKTVPVINWLPLWVKDVKVHGGLGSGALAGVFLGAQASIPFGLTLAAEFDSDDTNFGIWWSPIKPLRLKAESWGGDTFLGLQFVSPL